MIVFGTADRSKDVCIWGKMNCGRGQGCCGRKVGASLFSVMGVKMKYLVTFKMIQTNQLTKHSEDITTA